MVKKPTTGKALKPKTPGKKIKAQLPVVESAIATETQSGIVIGVLMICAVALLVVFGSSFMAGIIALAGTAPLETAEIGNNYDPNLLAKANYFKILYGNIDNVKHFDVYNASVASYGRYRNSDKCLIDVCVGTKCSPRVVTSCANGENNCRLQEAFVFNEGNYSRGGITKVGNWVYNCPNGCSKGACIKDQTYKLISNFFKNDLIAKLIIEGDNYKYELKLDNYYANDQINATSFEFKLINAFKQLGYSILGSINSPIENLNKFQKENKLPISSVVDKKTIILLDNKIYKSELEDLKYAREYQPYSKFIDAPLNEPSKEHLVKIFYKLFNSLPSNTLQARYWYGLMSNPIIISNILSEGEFLIGAGKYEGSFWGTIVDENSLDELDRYQISELFISNNYNYKFCADRYYSQIKTLNNFNRCEDQNIIYQGGIISDIAYAGNLAHEFSHQIGSHLTIPDDQTSRIDIIFGHISFDFSQNPWFSDIFLRRNNDQEFVSMYAKANHAEDFAESFQAYIMTGKIFRERAKQNPYLLQKYIFLKDEIFKGVEYDTGSLESYNLWLVKNGNTLPGFPDSYMQEDENWEWDYEYPIKK